jgi:hypothetical protein
VCICVCACLGRIIVYDCVYVYFIQNLLIGGDVMNLFLLSDSGPESTPDEGDLVTAPPPSPPTPGCPPHQSCPADLCQHGGECVDLWTSQHCR